MRSVLNESRKSSAENDGASESAHAPIKDGVKCVP